MTATDVAVLVALPGSAGAADWASHPVRIGGLTVPCAPPLLELAWQPARMLISHPLRRPDTGQQIPARTWTLAPLPVTRRAGVAIVHLPWMLLGFSDPSSHRIFQIRIGSVSRARVGAVRIDVAIPGRPLLSSRAVRWPGWNRVRFTERRKASWPILVRAFHRAAP